MNFRNFIKDISLVSWMNRKEVRNVTRTYFVTFDVTANVTFEVEAHDEIEAKEIANQLNVRDLQEVNQINTCESRMEVNEYDN